MPRPSVTGPESHGTSSWPPLRGASCGHPDSQGDLIPHASVTAPGDPGLSGSAQHIPDFALGMEE